MARPSKYTEAIAIKICELISSETKGLHAICKENQDLPSAKTVYGWLLDEDKNEFRNLYARAKDAQIELMVDEILDISDNKDDDNIFTDSGIIPNNEWMARSRLRVDSRKWLAAKLMPKKYGDKLEIDLNNKIVKVLVDPEDNDGNSTMA